VIRSTLARALDWRFGAVLARLDAVYERTERIERELAATRDLLEHRLQPMLRAIVDEDAENRRRLSALRVSPDYEAAFLVSDPLVSITVPTRNHALSLVGRALPSLLGQTHSNLEILVVGDAVEPVVAEAVAALGDSRIRYSNLSQRVIAHPDPDRHWLVGSTMARNEAARRARGQWLLHFDDDDYLRPDSIALMLNLARELRAEVAYGGFDTHAPAGEVARAIAFPPQAGLFGWQGALMHGGLRFLERELVAAHLQLPGDIYMLERALRAGVRFALLDRVVWDYFPSRIWEAPSS